MATSITPRLGRLEDALRRAVTAERVLTSGNVYLAQQVNLVRLTIQVFQMGMDFGPDDAAPKLEEHRSIVEAIAAQDPAAAENNARAHLRRVIDDLQKPVGSAT